MKGYLYGLTRAEKVERLDVPGGGYQPITFEETPGVPAQGGSGTTPPGSRFLPGIDAAAGTPLYRHLVLSREFGLHVHNVLDYAESRLAEGEPVDLDHVADLIAQRLRSCLQFVYRKAPEGR